MPERPDAFEIFWPRMTSHILDAVHAIMKHCYSANNKGLKNTLSKTASTDASYIEKVIMESKKMLEGTVGAGAAAAAASSISAAATNVKKVTKEDLKGMNTNQVMDALAAELGDDDDLENEMSETFDPKDEAAVV